MAQDLKNKAYSYKALLDSLGRNRQEFKSAMDFHPVGSPAYTAAKKKFDATTPEFNSVLEKYTAAQKAYDDFLQAEKDAKTTSKAKNLLQTKKDAIQRAIDYNASAAYIEQLQNDLKTLEQQAQGEGSPSVEEDDSIYVSDPDALAAYFGSATISQGSGGPTVQVTEPNQLDEQGKPRVINGFLYTEPSKEGIDKGVRFLTSDVAVDKYKKQLLALYGSQQGLVNKLYESEFLDSKKINPKTIDAQITTALNKAVQLYTIKQTEAVNTYGAKEVETLDEFLVPGASGGSDTTTERRAVVFDDTNADSLTISVWNAIFGKEPTNKQKKQARPFIQEFQRSKPQVTTTTTSAEGTQRDVVVNTAGDAERMLIDELAQTDQAKASQVLDFYDVFKSTIGVQ